MSEPALQTDVQRVLFEHDGLAYCRFRCPPGHGRWQRENRIGDGHNLAFPENPVEIAPARHPRIVADPNHVVFYNDGDAFRRRMLDVSGDVSNVLLFDSSHVVTALEDRDAFAGTPWHKYVPARLEPLHAAE